MEPSIAVQATNEPTNKLATGTNAAAGIGAVLAGVMAAYGGDAIREVWAAIAPVALQGPALVNLVVMAVTGAAAWYGSRQAGLMAGYNVLDRPNVPMAVAPSPTLPAAP